MTRPKVPPDQRQRTAQACEVCKRRKQKCNGLYPCNTCEKRRFQCIYSDRDPESPTEGPPSKKVHTESGLASKGPVTDGSKEGSFSEKARGDLQGRSPVLQRRPPPTSPNPSQRVPGNPNSHGQTREKSSRASALAESDPTEAVEAAARSLQHFSSGQTVEQHQKLHLVSGATSQSGHDEEAVIYSQMRMLQDPTGRLLYVGDSASLSFLQLLRMMVENVAGPSAFTTDPRRHKITETPFSLPPSTSFTHLLPDKKTARVLVDSFFVNTHGFMQVFDRHAFFATLDNCYADPLNAEPSWLCLLNLVFAIGLMLALPRSGTEEAHIIEKLQNQHADRAEVFYFNAKSLNDPLTGFEDADFWSVQALLLMSYYMLVKSKRNMAFALLGMAVRSAYALGLHREETMIIFSLDEQAARRNLWKSLFVMDRFLSFSLGRPTAISEDDCSGDTLRPSPFESESFGFDSAFLPPTSRGNSTACALEAAVRSCSVIGRILKQVYQQRKISTRLAQEIADVCKMWPKALAPSLHWRKAATATPSEGIAILHANLFYCHSIILLTRPFFLYIMNTETQRELASNGAPLKQRQKHLRMERFSEACVIASTHSIVLVQNAFEAGYLPRRNPCVIYFLFAATLVLLANEFAVLYTNATADQCIQAAKHVVAYCADSDPQAPRLFHILMAFQDAVSQQRERRRRQQEARMGNMAPSGASALPSFSTEVITEPAEIQPFDPQLQANLKPAKGMTDAHSIPSQMRVGAERVGVSPHTRPAVLPDKPTATTVGQPTGVSSITPNASAAPTPVAEISSMQFPLPQPDSAMESSALGAFPPELSRSFSLSNLLDLSALDSVGVPSIRSEDSSGPEELIDFDALWAWPSNTPAVGSPRATGDLQGVSDSAIPLFGVYDQ